MADEQVKTSNIDISVFKKAMTDMVAKSAKAWNDSLGSYAWRKTKEYTPEEVDKIIASSSITAMQQLSRTFFFRDGLYKRIIFYYATLLKYVGILIPNPTAGNELSTPYVLKRYNNALDYIDKLFLPTLFTQFSLRALVDGCYYGVIQSIDKTEFVILDLPEVLPFAELNVFE